MVRTSVSGGKKVICALAGDTQEDLVIVRELVEAGHLRTLIDRRFPLEEAADAHRYFETGQRKGKVVITLEHLLAA
jgi:NADPH:quinone reductase-like Zn-dependent oxidoreductase